MTKNLPYAAHAKTKLRYHIVFVTKYRIKFLDKIEYSLNSAFDYASSKLSIKIIIKKQDKNHVHLLIYAHPNLSISYIVKMLKQITTYQLWINERKFLSTIYWHKKKLLWAKGYFASTIGHVIEKDIKKYIENQAIYK
jgi:putative transposase